MCHIPKRVILALHIFCSGLLHTGLRVLISINIIAMVIHKSDNPIKNNKLNKDYGKRYDWDQMTQGYIFAAYFWGMIPAAFLSGWFIHRFGARNIITYSTIISGIMIIAVPFVCEFHWIVVCLSRTVSGAACGLVFPSMHTLVSKWAPKKEKGKFLSLLFGGNLGILIAWTTLGYIIEKLGWKWAWFIPAIVAFIWVATFRYAISDTPLKHKTITEKERNYIVSNIGESTIKRNRKIPYGHIFRNGPFWAVVLLQVGNMWGAVFLTTYSPKYLTEILNMELKQAGIVSGVAYVVRIISAIYFGVIGDYLQRVTIISTTNLRKILCIISHFIPGLMWLLITLVDRRTTMVIIFLAIGLGANGAVVVTVFLNVHEISPVYVGSLTGFQNAIATLTGIIIPYLMGALTNIKNSIEMWHISFYCTCAVFWITFLIFVLFGSAEVQPFNEMGIEDDHSMEHTNSTATRTSTVATNSTE